MPAKNTGWVQRMKNTGLSCIIVRIEEEFNSAIDSSLTAATRWERALVKMDTLGIIPGARQFVEVNYRKPSRKSVFFRVWYADREGK